jgi:hypothetical protein
MSRSEGILIYSSSRNKLVDRAGMEDCYLHSGDRV